MKSTPIKAVWALCFVGIMGGIASIFMKIALKEFTPVQIAFHRSFFAFMILLPVALATGKLRFRTRDSIRLIFASLLFSGNILLFVFGLQYTTSIASQLMYLLTPTLVITLSAVLFSTRILPKHVISIITGIAGGIILISRNSGTDLTGSLGTAYGNLIILGAVFSWSSYLVVSKKLSVTYHPLSLIVLNNAIISIISFFMVLVLKTDLLGAYMSSSRAGMGSMMALVLLNSILVFFLYQWSLKFASPFAVSISTYLSPLAAAVVAIPLFGEQITPHLILSAGLIIFSSYLTFQKKQ